MEKNKFSIGVEKLINPISVGTLHFMQSLSQSLPISFQKKLVVKASKKNPLMGFVVEPYCYFLCYEIKDLDFFQNLLPNNFELVKTKIFSSDTPKYYFIQGCFNARTSGFFGNRVEGYAISKNLKTGLLSWVILDYDTNTISYDSSNGLSSPTSTSGIITTNFEGDVIVDVKRNDGSNKIKFTSNIKNATLKDLDPTLWIEGNLSVAYAKNLSKDGDVFSLRFDPREMSSALEINLEDLNLIENNWYSNYIHSKPSKLVCFPYAQHFVSDAPGYSSNIKNKKELLENIVNIDFNNTQVYSSKSFKKMMVLVPAILFGFIIFLLILLIFTSI